MQTLPLLNKSGGTYDVSLHLELQLHTLTPEESFTPFLRSARPRTTSFQKLEGVHVLWMLIIVTHVGFLSFRIARQKGRIYPYRVLSFVLLSGTYATTIIRKLQTTKHVSMCDSRRVIDRSPGDWQSRGGTAQHLIRFPLWRAMLLWSTISLRQQEAEAD